MCKVQNKKINFVLAKVNVKTSDQLVATFLQDTTKSQCTLHWKGSLKKCKENNKWHD